MTTIRSGAPRVAPTSSQPTAPAAQPTASSQTAATGYSEASSFQPAPQKSSFKDRVEAGKKFVADKLPDGEVKDALKTFFEKPYPSNKDLEKALGAFVAARDSGQFSKEELKPLQDAVMGRMALKSTIDFALNSAKELFQKIANQKPESW